MNGLVHSINVSQGGVPNSPVEVANIMSGGLEGDVNRFRSENKNGDPDRAVCLFSLERIHDLQREGHPIEVGSTGENITIRGMDWSSLRVGMKFSIGASVIELSEPCAPCGKIGAYFEGRRFSRVDHDIQEGWSRWLARVVVEGSVSIGDSVNLVNPPPTERN